MALAKARIMKLHNGDFFDVMFNPEEYTLNRDNNFAAQTVPGLSSPLLQFVNGNLRTLEMELFFDTFEKHTDVRDETGKVIDLLQIDSELHAPPILLVSWGSLQFQCVLAKAAQRFNMFLDDGRPARARINVTFNEFIDEEHEAREVNRQTSDFTKAYAVEDGDTLSGLAGRIYADPAKWRAIAVANAIDAPLTIAPGQRLKVPSLPFTDALTGEVIQ